MISKEYKQKGIPNEITNNINTHLKGWEFYSNNGNASEICNVFVTVKSAL